MAENETQKAVGTEGQHSLAKILGIWALAAVPMGILGWVVPPALSADLDPLAAATTRIWALSVGLIWQFVLSMIIVRREAGDLRWATIRRRLRLNTPRNSKSGEPQARLWLWIVPAILLFFLSGIVLAPILEPLWVSLILPGHALLATVMCEAPGTSVTLAR